MCAADKIVSISKICTSVEDCAQSIMSKFQTDHQVVGGSWLFFSSSSKKFKCHGDSGYLTTNNKKLYLKAKSLRSQGMKKIEIMLETLDMFREWIIFKLQF